MRATRSEGDRNRTWLLRPALAVAATLAVAGCATPRVAGYGPPLPPDQYKSKGQPNPDDPYTFEILLDAAGCPSAVEVDRDWRKCPDQAPDCVRAKGGQFVRFQSATNAFVLQFDPFGKTEIAASGEPKEPLVLPTQQNPKAAKPYTFTIRGIGPACGSKVLDPQIILD